MKYIKKYNESTFTNNEVSDILDMLMEVIDELGLNLVKNIHMLDSANDIIFLKNDTHIKIYIRIIDLNTIDYNNIDDDIIKKSNYEFNKINNSKFILDFLNRVSSYGFSYKKEPLSIPTVDIKTGISIKIFN